MAFGRVPWEAHFIPDLATPSQNVQLPGEVGYRSNQTSGMFRTSGSFRLCFAAPQMVKTGWVYRLCGYEVIWISIQSCLLPSLGQRMSLCSLFSRLSALCLNQNTPFRNTPRLLWNDGESSCSCLSKIKIRDKTCFLSQMGAPTVTSGLVGGVPAHVGGLELDFYKFLPIQTSLCLIRRCDTGRDPYQWDSEHVNFAPCADTSLTCF